MMHTWLLFLGDALQIVALVAFLASPFMSTWKKTLVLAIPPVFFWCTLRLTTVIIFKEDSPPMIGFFVAPMFVALYAIILRGTRLVLQKFWRWSMRKII
jgi:hypothetical protein